MVAGGLHLSGGADRGGDGLADVGAGDAVAPGHEDRVVARALVEQRLRRAQVEHGGGRRAERLHAAEAGDAHDGVLARRAGVVMRTWEPTA